MPWIEPTDEEVAAIVALLFQPVTRWTRSCPQAVGLDQRRLADAGKAATVDATRPLISIWNENRSGVTYRGAATSSGTGIRIGRLEPGTVERDHRRAGCQGRARDDHPRRWRSRRRQGSGPDRRDRDLAASDGTIAADPVFAGYHQLNGNGEMTGIAWIEESGLL